MSTPRAYVEHVAIWVKDIHWHIRFFHDVSTSLPRGVIAPMPVMTTFGSPFTRVPSLRS